MSAHIIWQGTINRRYLEGKSKADIIDLYMGTLNELDQALGQVAVLVRNLREGEGVRYSIGPRMEAKIVAAEAILSAYGVDPFAFKSSNATQPSQENGTSSNLARSPLRNETTQLGMDND